MKEADVIKNVKTIILQMACGHYTYHVAEEDAERIARIIVTYFRDHVGRIENA